MLYNYGVKTQTKFLIIFAVVTILTGQLALAANEPPFIKDYCGPRGTVVDGRIQVTHGEEFVLCGTSLPASMTFINESTGVSTPIPGQISNDAYEILSVTIPPSLPSDQYRVIVSNPNGTVVFEKPVFIVDERPIFQTRTSVPVNAPKATEFQGLINNIVNYAFLIVGASVFIMILWGGFLWLTGAANPGNIANAKRKIYNAILGAVILAASYVILNTINPELVGGRLELPPIPRTEPGPIQPPPPTTNCNNPQALAASYGTAYPYGKAPELDDLIECVYDFPQAANLIDTEQVYTYEQTNTKCNYTRGDPVCGTCAHDQNSCHYGGSSGGTGALAVDFNAIDSSESGELLLKSYLETLRSTCNFGNIRFEQTSPTSWHTHISTQSCSGN